MKKQLIAALMLTQCMLIAGCGNANTEKNPASSSAPAVSETPAIAETTEEKAPQESAKADKDETQKVGNETVGYVSVPDTWVKFKDMNGGTAFQYSNPIGTDIISMNIFDVSGLTDAQKDQLDVKSAASSVWYNLETSAVTDINGAQVKLKDYDAYQVYGSYTSEDHGLASSIVCWIFQDEKGVIHYVSAEAPVENITDVVSYVEDSFTLSDAE